MKTAPNVEGQLAMYDHPWIPSDPSSRLTLRRIALTLAAVTTLALFAKSGQRMSIFFAMTGFAVMVSAALAMRARQKFDAPTLNYWDETVAYMAVSVLAMPGSGG